MSTVKLTVNGKAVSVDVEDRTLLVHLLRENLNLTGTHVGCEHGVCGACTVQIDGAPARACLVLAAQAEGMNIRTVEALAAETGRLSVLQQAFRDHHGLQCGFCTSGILMTLDALLAGDPDASEGVIRDALSGNLCRCTGYEPIVRAALAARDTLRKGGN